LGGEGDEQEDTADESGVEYIVTESTEGHFGDGNSGDGTDDNDPRGKVRGEIESEEYASEDGGAIRDGGGDAEEEFLDEPLNDHASGDGEGGDNEEAESVVIKGYKEGRDEGEKDVKHVFAYGITAVDVRGRGDVEHNGVIKSLNAGCLAGTDSSHYIILAEADVI
jgi:hypothetical protein